MDKPSTSRDPNLFNSCAFCPTEKSDLYKCPRCESFYCSLRCYKSQKHQACSEEFYKKQCMDEEEGATRTRENGGEEEATPSEGISRPTVTFEEYMREMDESAQGEGGIDDEEANPQIEVDADEEIVFDSDDEPEYLTEVLTKSVSEFEKLGTEDLDRRMLLAGLPGLGSRDEEQTQKQMDALYASLTDEEKRAFNRLADEVMQDQMGLTQSCFAGKKSAGRKDAK